MNDETRFLAQHLSHAGVSSLNARDRRVIQRVARRAEVARERDPVSYARPSSGGRLAERAAAVGGSRAFIAGFGVFLAASACLNALALAGSGLGPYPSVVLNLLLPVLAGLQALLVVTSRDRHSATDRQAAARVSGAGLASETAIAELHDKVDRLAAQVDRLARPALPSRGPAPASAAAVRPALRVA